MKGQMLRHRLRNWIGEPQFVVDCRQSVEQLREQRGWLMERYDLVTSYEEAVTQIASWLNQWMRFGVTMNTDFSDYFGMIALAWNYCESEFPDEKKLYWDNYETFIECLRTDVYMRLYRRISDFYGVIEPKEKRL